MFWNFYEKFKYR